jgi:hypothetical protein
MTYLLACNLVVQHIISCNWVLPVGNIFIIIIIIIIIIKVVHLPGCLEDVPRDSCIQEW